MVRSSQMATRSGTNASFRPAALWALFAFSAPACSLGSDLCNLSAEWCGEPGTAPGDPDDYRAVVLGDGPLGYWRLGDADPPVALDQTGKLDGLYSGGVLLGQAGIRSDDTAAHFDGQGDDLMSLGDNFDAPMLAAFTLEAWVKPDSVGNDMQPICSKAVYVGDALHGYTLEFHDQAVILRRCREGVCDGASGPPIEAGKYSHVVGAFDGVTLYVYVDGKASTAPSSLEVLDTDAAFVWAGSLSTYGLFAGALDEVALYGYALGPQKVEAHLAAGTYSR